MTRGYALIEKGDWDGALAEYREAVRLDPKNSEAHAGIGTALQLGKKDYDGAIAEYHEAARLDPGNVDVHLSLGSALSQKGLWDGAIVEYRYALRLDPRNALAHELLGKALGTKGDYDGEITEEREALRLDPQSDTAHQYLGEALGRKGDREGESHEESEALRLNPENDQARSHLDYANSYIKENREFKTAFFGFIGVFVLLGFPVGNVFFIKGFLVYRKFRFLEDTPEIPIRSIAMGVTQTHGKAVGQQTVPGPVSKKPCYFYEVGIEAWGTDSKGKNGAWMHYATFADGVKFYLKDATGKVLVDAHGAEYDLLRSGKQETVTPWKSTAWREVDKEWGAFIERAKPGSYPGLYRMTEYTVLPNQPYDLIGTCVENPEAKDEHDRKMIVKGQNEKTFSISCWSEQTVERELRKTAVHYVFGGAGLAITSLAMFLITNHWSHWI